MNSVIEKEKKLNLALTKLKNLNLKNPDIKKNIENLITKVSHFDLKNEVLFRVENVPEITKIQDIVKMCLQASKMSPRASKIIKKLNAGLKS